MSATEEDRKLADFTSIESHVPFAVTVNVNPQNSNHAKVSTSQGQSPALSELNTTVNNNILNISYNQQQNSASGSSSSSSYSSASAFSNSGESISIINGVVYRNGQRVDGGASDLPHHQTGNGFAYSSSGNQPQFQIHIDAKQVENVTLNGVGSLRVDYSQAGNIPNVQVHLTGTGQLEVDSVNSQEVRANLSGTGEVKIAGRTRTLSVDQQGTGQFDGVDLSAEDASVNVGGTGQAKVNVTGVLSGSISGVGGIGYRGTPRDIQVNKSFVGRLYQI